MLLGGQNEIYFKHPLKVANEKTIFGTQTKIEYFFGQKYFHFISDFQFSERKKKSENILQITMRKKLQGICEIVLR